MSKKADLLGVPASGGANYTKNDSRAGIFCTATL